MKLSVLQENLLKALSRISKIISTKPQLPILTNVLLRAENQGLRITATNLETTEVLSVGAKVEKEGALCLSARLFAELVSSLPQEAVALTQEKESLRVVCGGVNAVLSGAPAGEFPAAPEAGAREKTKIAKDELVRAATRVLFAAATDEGRPILTGIKIGKEDGRVVFVATDGYRLSVQKTALAIKTGLDMVVPARALSEVVRACADEKSDNPLLFSTLGEEGQVAFEVSDAEIYTRLIDGEYPQYGKIIPKIHATGATIDREALTRAVKSAAIFARDSANIVRLHVGGGTIEASANAPQIGENTIRLEAKTSGEDGDIAFNSRFLLEFLGATSAPEVVFEMTGSLNPGVFRLEGEPDFLHIIMPVRVQA